MKKRILVIFSIITMLTLSACGNLKNSDLSNNATNTSKKKSYQTTSTNDNNYNVLLKNGTYVASKITGITATNNGNSVDLSSLEKGLINISLSQYSKNKYAFQEGQLLSTKTVSNWLGRKSKSNPTGLNPADNGKTEANERNPIFLEQLIEADFLVNENNNYQVKGVSLGLAMNSTDYYQKEKDGARFTTTISKATQLEEGKKIANVIIQRLRKQKEFKNIPITIGIFSKTAADSLVGGTYLAYGTAKENATSIENFTSLNEKSQVLPVVGDEKAINSNDAEAFANFKSAIENYFPKISGVIGRVHYTDNQLTSYSITVNTQFFGYEQINSFTKLALSSAKQYLPNGVKTEIIIKSVNDTQAIIFKNDADSEYQIHVLDQN